MGAGKKRREAFLAKNAVCYFCGAEATTIDHVPARECFRDRVGPEGYEFPACAECNNTAGPIEQVVALYLIMGNHDGMSSVPHMQKLIRGVHNNNPQFLPVLDLTANEKRRAIRGHRFMLPAGQPFSHAPVARLPEENREAFKFFERRLVCALYYKHMSAVLLRTHLIRTHRVQAIATSAEDLIREAAPMMPNAEHGNRQNTNIGEQFLYVWYGDPKTEIFTFLAQFSKSFVFVGIACPPEAHEGGEDYYPHSEDLRDKVENA
ncbi:hypothetical protein GFB56_05525 [Ensifer sp. T173]|uniref:HNH endonuclease 5 domain-containing protein n=1 Tax=Ensifer canadensis TaxID=555315 RepID=A0AAW4FDP5_9HYPH|nr:hypothetical protein [Ensifer canadensis]MBM3090273.1 hypothetical protein [Ensifer canadensis]UBI75806.1 hypothetical protein J3R84_01200 [Ensifer canadensis]